MERVPNNVYASLMSTCKGCVHPDRAVIDQQIVAGVDFRTLAATYHLFLGGLSRHREHVKQLLAESMRVQEGERAERGSALMVRVEKLLDDAEEILSTAKSKQNLTAATGAINACTRLLELCGRLSGELQAPGAGIHFHSTRNVTNVVNINDDTEIAQMFAEFTRNFHPDEIERLKLLVSASAPSQPQS